MPPMTPAADAIRVECYAGHRGEQTPRRFTVDERQIEVTEVVDSWLGPDHRYFKVTGDDGFTYLLEHDVRELGWRLTGSGSTGGCSRGEVATQ